MSVDTTHLIEQYVSFEFFDSAGIVPTEFGNILYFSNKEIMGSIAEGEKVSTQVQRTRGGLAAGSVVTLPRSYSFSITPKYDQRTYGKIRRLNEAIGANYRIRFKVLSGYLLWDEAFGTFQDYAPNVSTVFEWSVVDVGDIPNYRNIFRGHGLTHAPYPIIVYEADALPVPEESDQTGDVEDEIETQLRNVGGINIPFTFVT